MMYLNLIIMNSKLRLVYLLSGVLGLLLLAYQVVGNFHHINAGIVLLITVTDIVLLFLAYKTYPVNSEDVKDKVKLY